MIVIDLPQLVDIVSNPNGMTLLQRDCDNVCNWFIRRGVVVDPDELFSEIAAEVY